jgi:hypothetical protein
MIASLIEYFTKERDHGGPLLSLKSIQQVREKFNVMFIIKQLLKNMNVLRASNLCFKI